MTTLDSIELTITTQQLKDLKEELMKQNVKEWVCNIQK